MISVGNCIVLLFGLSLPIDMLNGYFINAYGIGILSQVYKISVLLICLLYLFSKDIVLLFKTISFLFIMSVGTLYFYSTHGSFGTVIESLQIAMRCVMFIVFMRVLAISKPNVELVGKVCVFSLLVFILNFILGHFGMGYSAYGNVALGDDDTLGVKGFFYSGNELSFVIMIFSLFSVTYFKKQYFSLLFMLLLILCALLLATKTAVMATLVILFSWICGKTSKVAMIFIAAILGVATYYLISVFVSDIISSGQFQRLIWMYQTGGITRAILSDRDNFVYNAFISSHDSGFTLGFLSGFGRDYFNEIKIKSSVEMDIIDLYLWFGVAGIYFFFKYFSTIRNNLYGNFDGDKAIKYSCVAFFWMTIIVSFIAGHVVYSGTALIPLCMVLYLLSAVYKRSVE